MRVTVKFCAIDDQVVIAGNGNQDTQSWYHSQECNVMVDSPQLCAEWRAALEHNQNTGALGAVDEDGLWRDREGNVVQSSGGTGECLVWFFCAGRGGGSVPGADQWGMFRRADGGY